MGINYGRPCTNKWEVDEVRPKISGPKKDDEKF